MNKKFALLFSFLITIIIASNFFLLKSLQAEDAQITEEVTLTRVIDGDTIELGDGRIVRLLNVNSPEKDFYSFALGRDFLKLFENKLIKLETAGKDKYLRSLARIYSLEGEYLNLALVEKGFASKFLVSLNELKKFDSAEQSAIKNSRGIWKKSAHFGCFETKIDEKNEIIAINNSCREINIQGWALKDESRKVYFFKNVNFEYIYLHTQSGKDNETDIFWGSTQSIWNNDRDTLYLFDEDGKIVHYASYGY